MANIDASKLRPGTLGTEVNALVGQDANAVIIKGVVEEIIYSPETFDYEAFAERIADPKTYVDIPANSLLVRIISGKEYKSSKKPVSYTHLTLPTN